MSKEISKRLSYEQQKFPGNSLKIPRKCSEMSLDISQMCSEKIPEKPRKCLGKVPEMSQKISGMFPDISTKCKSGTQKPQDRRNELSFLPANCMSWKSYRVNGRNGSATVQRLHDQRPENRLSTLDVVKTSRPLLKGESNKHLRLSVVS